jgi:TusA-related sulfurtransferase
VSLDETPEVLDLSELSPPEPLERLLHAAAALGPGESLVALLPRDPVHARPHLVARGLAVEVAVRPDGRALVTVRR